MTKKEREARLTARLNEMKGYDDSCILDFNFNHMYGIAEYDDSTKADDSTVSAKNNGSPDFYLAGVDEVGRGPLAGPVVTACVVLPRDFDLPGVDDSKKLSEKKREELYEAILKKAVSYGIGLVDNDTIDKINILEATKLAMKQSIENCNQMLTEKGVGKINLVLIDAVKLEGIDTPQKNIIKGDATSLSIAAASIIAKVTRDRMMVEYAKKYPWYGFESNKGYGTKVHYEGIASHGITPIHRKSFLKNL